MTSELFEKKAVKTIWVCGAHKLKKRNTEKGHSAVNLRWYKVIVEDVSSIFRIFNNFIVLMQFIYSLFIFFYLKIKELNAYLV